MSYCLFGVLVVVGKDEGSSQSRDVKTEAEEGVAMGDEGVGVGGAGSLDVWSLRRC